ncbi:MAG: glycosyltransferase family 4 protein [Planctomycetota bacterium]
MSIRVGVITYLRARGLGYDAVALRDVFGSADGIEASWFSVEDLYRVDRMLRKRKIRPSKVSGDWAWPEAERRLDLLTWVGRQDVVITLEVFMREVAAAAFTAGARLIHVPNLEWISDREGWRTDLAAADAVVAKTRHTERALTGAGLTNVTFLPWSVPMEIEPPRPHGSPLTFFHSAGIGGSHDPKNPEAVLAAFTDRFAGRDDVRLVFKSQVPPKRRKAPLDLAMVDALPNVEVIVGEVSTAEMMDLSRAADVAVYPSRAEGFGLPLLESRSLSVPVITTDAPPMNELVEDGVSGLLVPGVETGRHRHVPLIEVDREALADAMERATDPALLMTLKAGAARGLPERRKDFRHQLLTLLSPPYGVRAKQA